MIIVINNRNFNFKGIIDNYDFCHNRAALIQNQSNEVSSAHCLRDPKYRTFGKYYYDLKLVFYENMCSNIIDQSCIFNIITVVSSVT